MFELFAAPLAWVGQKTAEAVIGQLAERGVERFSARQRQTVVPEAAAAPTRHRLGDVTSDVDIVVQHRPATRQPVLLTFQATPLDGERTSGVTVPMVLGETAHLTLPRADYLISALVLDPLANIGDKPVLRAVGGIRHYLASTRTEQLTIVTGAPTATLLTTLGLLKPDGTGPFRPALPPAPAPPPRPPSVPDWRASLETMARQNARLQALTRAMGDILDAPAQAKAPEAAQCRAAASDFGPRCTSRIGRTGEHGLCLFHNSALKLGATVYDWVSGKPIT